MKRPTRKQTIVITAVAAAAVVAVVLLVWAPWRRGGKAGEHRAPPPVTVTTTIAKLTTWRNQLGSVGTLTAVQSVSVTTEVPGKVVGIAFHSGGSARQGDLLVQLDDAEDRAHLHSLEADEGLAAVKLVRAEKLIKIHAISRTDLDTARATLASAQAAVEEQKQLIAKKHIQAPFSGLLGIRQVNLGQYVSPGTDIVELHTLAPIYADFTLPQQDLPRIDVGEPVTVTTDAFPKQTFTGKITAVSPAVAPKTRNFSVRASLANPNGLLRPGMFGQVTISLPGTRRVITLPQTAISYNPYGDFVYLVKRRSAAATPQLRDPPQTQGKAPAGPPTPTGIAVEVAVTPGETRGDLVEIKKGVKPGDEVVTSGQLKLRNGAPVIVNNRIQPAAEESPAPKGP